MGNVPNLQNPEQKSKATILLDNELETTRPVLFSEHSKLLVLENKQRRIEQFELIFKINYTGRITCNPI